MPQASLTTEFWEQTAGKNQLSADQPHAQS